MTASPEPTAAFSEIDSDRSGFALRGRIWIRAVCRVLQFCTSEQIDLLIARCPHHRI
jgi:hypothetical protein